MDFIEFINTEWEASATKKQALLDDFCEHLGYQKTVGTEDGNPIPNPVTKKEFANERIARYIIETVNVIRKRNAEKSVSFEELSFE